MVAGDIVVMGIAMHEGHTVLYCSIIIIVSAVSVFILDMYNSILVRGQIKEALNPSALGFNYHIYPSSMVT